MVQLETILMHPNAAYCSIHKERACWLHHAKLTRFRLLHKGWHKLPNEDLLELIIFGVHTKWARFGETLFSGTWIAWLACAPCLCESCNLNGLDLCSPMSYCLGGEKYGDIAGIRFHFSCLSNLAGIIHSTMASRAGVPNLQASFIFEPETNFAATYKSNK